ncbi:TlpA family protein disulfide reductase [Halovenus salina]|uniref:TlpA family protein disulfide reductase n=1 Tax=Halovenus salina TaxID=1510225 RepID=A0ABD5W932_9EURY|nr:TlpA disulfide reductase family protein [Halovenus salina]
MRRRELLAGLGSVGVLAGAGVVALNGLPTLDDTATNGDLETTDSGDGDGQGDRVTVETIDAPGSEAGEVTVPSTEQATFVDFFGTWCPPCVEQMPALYEANERVGDRVRFMSVTTEPVGDTISEQEVVDWWEEHDGNWLLGTDPRAELAARYLAGGYPSAVAIDAAGRVQWSDAGVKTADELVDGIERALESDE